MFLQTAAYRCLVRASDGKKKVATQARQLKALSSVV